MTTAVAGPIVRWRASWALPRRAGSLLAVAALLLLWQLAVVLADVGRGALPSPTAIATDVAGNLSFYWRHASATGSIALIGYAWGVSFGIALGLFSALARWAERPVMTLSLAVFCLPLTALAPILTVLIQGDGARVALTAIFAFFPALIGTAVGFRSAPGPARDVVRASGGNRLDEFARVNIRSATPSIIAGLRIAAPNALLGAIVGELIGARAGLGVILVVAQQTINPPRVWGIAAVTTALALGAYGLVGLLGRLLGTGSVHVDLQSPLVRPRSAKGWRRAASTLMSMVVSTVIVVGLWYLVVVLRHANPLVAKTPADVWRYLITDAAAGDHRSVIFAAWRTTMNHTLVSLVAGMVCAVAASLVFVLWPSVRSIGMPTALTLQCVPLIAFVPVITVLLGRSTLGVASVGAVVVGAPALILIVSGFERVSAQSLDLVTSAGGSPLQAARFVRLPAATPGVLGAARIGAPLAIMGALTMEWLVVGGGLGSYMTRSAAQFDYAAVWSAVVVMTLTSVVLYSAASAAERWAVRRFS